MNNKQYIFTCCSCNRVKKFKSKKWYNICVKNNKCNNCISNKCVPYCTNCGIKKANTSCLICRKCHDISKRGKKLNLTDEVRKSMGDKVRQRLLGTHLPEQTRKKISEKSKIQMKGKGNPMYGKSVYNVWISKYGKEEADKRQKQQNKKLSEASSGSKNGMYGKPSPQGSGNGWSGWYKNWYFRSLRELTYMINVIERFNLEWKSADQKELRVKYKDYNNSERTYFPDFLIANKYLVEIKPKKLWMSQSVQSKSDAAKKFCKENNLTYKIRDIKLLDYDEIKQLYDTKQIKFTKKYEIKFNNFKK